MINFLHVHVPEPVLIRLGALSIYWYGIFIVTGMLLAMFITFRLADRYQIKKDAVVDLAFWLILGGIAGARLYHVALELPHYIGHPAEIFMIWHGGLAIHGAIIAGLIIIWLFSRKHGLDFWCLTSILTPGIALGQALGRWGNYFNQELFGTPTDMPWGIPIELARRPAEYSVFTHFHPTFLYESIGNLLIFVLLWLFHIHVIQKERPAWGMINGYRMSVIGYLALYSILRFSLEFIRIDPTPVVFGLRWPQIASLVIITVITIYLILTVLKRKKTIS